MARLAKVDSPCSRSGESSDSGEEESDEDTDCRGKSQNYRGKSQLNKLPPLLGEREDPFGYNSPRFQTIFGQGISNRNVDDAIGSPLLSELNFPTNGGSNSAPNQGPSTPVAEKSRDNRREKPSAANKSSKQPVNPVNKRKKAQSRIKRNKKQDEVDDSRPDTDKACFEKIQQAKALQRRLKNLNQTRPEYSATATMPVTTRNNPFAIDDEDPPLSENIPRKKGTTKDQPRGKNRPKHQTTEQDYDDEGVGQENNRAPDENNRASRPEKGANGRASAPKRAPDENDRASGPEKGANERTSAPKRAPDENDRTSRPEKGANERASAPKQGTKRKESPTNIPEEAIMEEALARYKVEDGKIPLNKRGKKIEDLRKELYVATHNYNNAIQYRVKFKQLQKEMVILRQARVQDASVVQNNAIALKVNQEILKQCEDLAKTKLWRHHKFISDHAGEVEAAEYVLNLLDLPQMQDEDTKASLIKTYKKPIKKANYAKKSYVTSELRKVFLNMKKDNEPIPTTQDVLKCITRDINTENDMKLFMWYWDVLLVKMIGKKEWDVEVKYYNTISSATCPDNKQERLISVSDEAMCLLLWENNLERWEEWYEWKNGPSQGTTKAPKRNGKYTSSDLGQCKWGGWAPEGFVQFNKYFQMVKKARKDKRCLQVEKKCLEMLRCEKKITKNTHAEQDAENRKQKRAEKKGVTLEVGVAIPTNYSHVRPMVDNDSEEEVDDEDMDSDEE